MEAGEIIIKTKIVLDDFKEGLKKAKDIAKEKGKEAGNVFSNFFSKGFSKLKNGLINAFSKITGFSATMTKAFLNTANIITKLGLGLGVAGVLLGGIIASAYILQNAFKRVFEENEELKANLQYIIWAFGQALEPAVDFVAKVLVVIINLIIKAIQYLAVFIKMLTGRNIFEKANHEAFAQSMKDAEENSKKTAKNAKEIRKQLAGFDEMNILSDNSGVSAVSGTNWGTPTFNLADLTQAELELMEFKNEWFTFGSEMRYAIEDMPFEKWTEGFGEWDLAVYGVTETVLGLWDICTGFAKDFEGIVKVIHGVITGNNEETKEGIEDLDEGTRQIVQGLQEFITGIVDTIQGVIKGVLETIFGDYETNINDSIDNLEKFKNEALEKWEYVKEGIKDKIENLKKWLTDHFGTIGTYIGDIIGNSIYNAINFILGWIESKINGFIGSINHVTSTINSFTGSNIKTIPYVSIPRLAKGGIINMPGRGVPVGSAIGGERGAEGVIPLTDSQQMALLGEAIGKYININATVPVYVGNRQIAREIRKIEAENDFAYNG